MAPASGALAAPDEGPVPPLLQRPCPSGWPSIYSPASQQHVAVTAATPQLFHPGFSKCHGPQLLVSHALEATV